MGQVSYTRGVILVLAAGVLWSLMGLVIRLLADVTTWQVLFWRSLGMAPVLIAFIAWRSGGRPWGRFRAAGRAGVVGGLCLVLAFAGAIYAIQSTTVANAVFLFAAAPLVTAVLAWPVLREPVRTGTWGAIALALAGIGMMVREGLAIGGGAGNAAALASAAGFAGFTLALRHGRLGDMLPGVALGGVFAAAAAAVVLVLAGDPVLIPARDIALAMGMGVVLLAGGMMAYTLGSRALPAADLALLSMIEVMLAPVWVWLVLGETVGAGTLAGGAILLAALAGNAVTGMRHRHLTPV